MDRGYYSLETLSLLLTLKAKCVWEAAGEGEDADVATRVGIRIE